MAAHLYLYEVWARSEGGCVVVDEPNKITTDASSRNTDRETIVPGFFAKEIKDLDVFADSIAAHLDATDQDLFHRECPDGTLPTGFEAEPVWSGTRDLVVEIAPGFRLGPYRVARLIAVGGMGAVFEAEHIELERQVALKVISRDTAAWPSTFARFKHEVRFAASLDHPHVVKVYDAGELEGYCYLAMELIDGPNLVDLVRQRGTPPPQAAIAICLQIAFGLAEMHSSDLIHRDVKPSNIVLVRPPMPRHALHASSSATAKLLDLGLATRIGVAHSKHEPERVTLHGTIVGTLDYMSPEQASGERDPDPSWDVYGLGATLFYLVVGKSPFDRHVGHISKLSAKARGDEALIDDLALLPKECRDLVGRMLAKDRPADAEEALTLLQAHADQDLLDNWFSEDATLSEPHGVTSSRTEEKPNVHAEISRPNWWKPRRFLGVTISLLVLAMGIVVATDNGHIVVQSDAKNVKITVLRDVEPVFESIKIDRGGKRIRLRSGEYSIVVTGNGSDEYVVDGGEIVVSRNSVHEVKIRLRKQDARQLPPADQKPKSSITASAAIQWMLNGGAEIVLAGSDHPITELSTDGSKQLKSLRIDGVIASAQDFDAYIAALPPVSESAWFDGLNMTHKQLQDLLHTRSLLTLRHLTIERSAVPDLVDLTFLPNLHDVSFLDMRLSKQGFENVCGLRGLTHLKLIRTGASDSSLEKLDTSQLELLWLDRNPGITDGVASSLRDASRLQILNLSDTRITDKFLLQLVNAPLLWALHLSGTQVTDDGLQTLARMRRLRQLSLTRTTISANGLEKLSDLPLTELWLDDNPQLDDEAAAQVAGFSDLTLLSVVRTSVTEKGIQSIARLSKLRELFLTGIGLNETALAALEEMRSLRKLFVWDCGLLAQDIERLKSRLPDCEIFYK